MKKTLIAILCTVLVIAVAFVLIKKDKPAANDDATTSSVSQQQTTKDDSPAVQNGTKDPDKLLEITMPLSYYDAINKCDIAGFFSKGSYESCRINEKQKTFTVTVKSITHDFMLSNVGLQVIKNLASMLDSGSYPYLKGLGKYNADFSEIEIIVDGNAYKSASGTDKLLDFIGSCGIFYQLYTEENSYKCKVTVTDEKTGEEIAKETFRQNNSDLKS